MELGPALLGALADGSAASAAFLPTAAAVDAASLAAACTNQLLFLIQRNPYLRKAHTIMLLVTVELCTLLQEVAT